MTDCCTDRRALADPTVWLDNKGNFHVFSHAYVPVDVLAPYRYADVVGGEQFADASFSLDKVSNT